MEEDNGLELSLGLTMCPSSSKPKHTTDNSSDTKTEESDRSSKLINDFKHFLDGGTGNLESASGSHKSDTLKPDERGKGIESSNRRDFFFEEINNHMKRERKSQNSHISINTDDGSTAENDDVADSEAVRILSHHDNDNGKRYKRSAGRSELGNDVYTVFDTSAADASRQRGFTITNEKELRARKVPYSVTYPSQSVNILNMPRSISSKEIHSSCAEMFPQTTNMLNVGSINVSQAANTSAIPQYNVTIAENTRTESKQHPKDASIQPPSELSSITPGIDSDLKFGGCGSYPNLPWVSTKGPNGRTISGVTYKFSPTQIKIVCACHGSHMSPEEFVQHASEVESGRQSEVDFSSLNNTSNNPTASAQS